MKQKTESTFKKNIVNFFGSLGYLFGFLQWFWVVMLYFSLIQSLTSIIIPTTTKHVQQSSGYTLALPNSSEMIILAIVVAIMVVVTIYIFIKIPMGIVQTSNKIVHKTAESITPIVIKAQHKKDTKKFHLKITSKLILAIKLLFIIIAVILTAMSGLLERQAVDYSIAIIIGCTLACFSILFFAIQYLLSTLFGVKLSELW